MGLLGFVTGLLHSGHPLTRDPLANHEIGAQPAAPPLVSATSASRARLSSPRPAPFISLAAYNTCLCAPALRASPRALHYSAAPSSAQSVRRVEFTGRPCNLAHRAAAAEAAPAPHAAAAAEGGGKEHALQESVGGGCMRNGWVACAGSASSVTALCAAPAGRRGQGLFRQARGRCRGAPHARRRSEAHPPRTQPQAASWYSLAWHGSPARRRRIKACPVVATAANHITTRPAVAGRFRRRHISMHHLFLQPSHVGPGSLALSVSTDVSFARCWARAPAAGRDSLRGPVVDPSWLGRVLIFYPRSTRRARARRSVEAALACFITRGSPHNQLQIVANFSLPPRIRGVPCRQELRHGDLSSAVWPSAQRNRPEAAIKGTHEDSFGQDLRPDVLPVCGGHSGNGVRLESAPGRAAVVSVAFPAHPPPIGAGGRV